jgi:hypothetical protein
MQDDAFGFSMQGVVSMIAALYELEEEDQESTGMSPGMLVKRSSELAKGLEVVKTEIASFDAEMETADDASEMAAAVYDLNRVIGMLQDLSHLDREDVKKREKELMKSFHDIKRDIKDILESLNSLEKTKDGKIRTKSRRSRQSDREEMKQEPRTFDIRVDLDDVLAMITALGIAEDDEDDAESILTPKDIKARSQKLAQLLPGVLARLETFLETSSYSGAASEAYGVTELIESHVVVLKRILDVVDAVCGARDANEVELAVYRTYNSFQGLQREAREVLTSIYSIQVRVVSCFSHHRSAHPGMPCLFRSWVSSRRRPSRPSRRHRGGARRRTPTPRTADCPTWVFRKQVTCSARRRSTCQARTPFKIWTLAST